MTEAPAIRSEALGKDYVTDWRGRSARALDGVSFSVGAGRICALVGANGAGKSTWLKIAAGLSRPTRGRCDVFGRASTERTGSIGYAPEMAQFPAHLAVGEMLTALARLGGASAEAARTATEQALARVRLLELAKRKVRELSKGQRQRVALAQSLVRDARVLLWDEPASALDPRGVAELGQLLVELRGENRTVVLSSHFLPQLEAVCDQFILLHAGRVLFDGTGADVRQRGGLTRLFLELSAG